MTVPGVSESRRLAILVTDDVDAEGLAVLRAEPLFDVREVPTLAPPELLGIIPDYHAVVGRSATRINAELLRRGVRLRVVGRAGVGTDNIDLPTATALGIAVINAPAGNTIAVAELFFGALIGLLRKIPEAVASMRGGRWDRSRLLGAELKGRTLGVVGMGRIGAEVAHRATAFGMTVLAYDPYVSDERFTRRGVRRMPTLESLLSDADVVTVHTPLTDETRSLIGASELALLRPGAVVVNMARGGIVDESALTEALATGRIGGAVLDVYTTEPLPPASPLRTLPTVVLTPHLGASTGEAQRNVAVDVCIAVRDALLTGELSKTINIADAVTSSWPEVQPAIFLARRAAAVGRAVLAEQGGRAVLRIAVRVSPELGPVAKILLSAAAAGALEGVIDEERLNLINATTLAEARGIELSDSVSAEPGQPHALQVSLTSSGKEITIAGVAPPGAIAPRITQIGEFHVDISPRQSLVILTNNDVPGVIGRVGTVLGDAGVNIAEYHQARLARGGEALAAIAIDGAVGEEVRQRLLAVPDVRSAAVAIFRDG
ncbi:MAG: phosphoglycerate dehydrogenase [Gemmatimonadota bacterium]|nr:phosphoglycerate dehydrogenase [Gemmatimonadota bacterium]